MTPALTTDKGRSHVADKVLDMQQLLERCMGSLELAERCLVRFEQKLRADVENIRRCVDTDNRGELAQLAHGLKGSAATVSAIGLARSAAALEDYARGKGPPEPDELVAGFREQVDRFLSAVPQLSQVG